MYVPAEGIHIDFTIYEHISALHLTSLFSTYAIPFRPVLTFFTLSQTIS